MKRRISIVSQNFIVGGIETRLHGHCNQLIAAGMEVFLLTGLFYKKKFLPKGLKKIFHLDCFHPFVRGVELENEINAIASIIRDNQIDLVIVHPHLSIPSATFAARKCRVRCGIVLHGFLNLENYYRWTHKLLVQIALNITDFIELVSEEVLELTKPFIYHNRYFIERNKICYSTFTKNLSNKNPYSILHNYPIHAAQQNLQQGIQSTKKLNYIKDLVLFFSYRFYLKLPIKLQTIARNLLINKLRAKKNVPENIIKNQ